MNNKIHCEMSLCVNANFRHAIHGRLAIITCFFPLLVSACKNSPSSDPACNSLSSNDTSSDDVSSDDTWSDTPSSEVSETDSANRESDDSDTDANDTAWTNGIAPLHTEGNAIKDPKGNTVVLRGVALADPVDVYNRDPSMTTQRLLDILTDEEDGFYTRIVRLTVFPDIWLINDDPTRYFYEHYRPVVERATELGLYIIIDWHEISDVETVAKRTTAFWEFMAPQFANYTNVLYEIFNEPMNFSDTSWRRWKPYAQAWVDQIRESAPNNIILIGGPYWDQQIGGAATDPVEGENLVYVGHIYPPAAAALLGDDSPIAAVAQEHPVIISEWGFCGDPAESNLVGTVEDFGEPLKAFIEARGLSWTAWLADSQWGPPKMFDESWNLLVGSGEMGGFVKDWLAKRRDQDQPIQGPQSDADTDTDTDADADSDTDADTDITSNTDDDTGAAECIGSKLPPSQGVVSYEFCVPDDPQMIVEVRDILAPLGEDNYSYAQGDTAASFCSLDSAYLFTEIPGDTSREILCALSLLSYIDRIIAVIPL